MAKAEGHKRAGMRDQEEAKLTVITSWSRHTYSCDNGTNPLIGPSANDLIRVHLPALLNRVLHFQYMNVQTFARGRLNLGRTQCGWQRYVSTVSLLQICLFFSCLPGLCISWAIVDVTKYLTTSNLVREKGFNLILERSVHSPWAYWFWVYKETDAHDVGSVCRRGHSPCGRQEPDRKGSRTKYLKGLTPSDLILLMCLHCLKLLELTKIISLARVQVFNTWVFYATLYIQTVTSLHTGYRNILDSF